MKRNNVSVAWPVVWALLRTFSWQELRLHPWRHSVAVLAVTLGVGLALSVHLINAAALSEFSAAVQTANGEPDAQLRSATGVLDDRWLEAARAHPAVRFASPVLELQAVSHTAQGERVVLRWWGVDALAWGPLQPTLALQPLGDRLDLFASDAVFLNPAAQLALAPQAGQKITLQTGLQQVQLRPAGKLAQPGGPLLVMDIAALQDASQRPGELSRIDLRLQPGSHVQSVFDEIRRSAWMAGPPAQALVLQQPGDNASRLSQLSRAYRVNLTVLALVALFTGSFLVFSVLSLSVTQRSGAFALLGVLGLDGRQRQRLVWAESVLLGLVGSVLGIALGTALAWGALLWLGGDLGGGYFDGVAPQLQWDVAAMLGYGALGVCAAVGGGVWPALRVRTMAPALALKGVIMQEDHARGGWTQWVGPGLLLAAAGLAALPPVAGLPLAAYAAVAALLLGGILTLPSLVHSGLALLSRRVQGHALLLLAVERARRFPGTAALATSGVVASLALSVALTVMVSSFRQSVTQWLDVVLPADLYVRAASAAGSATSGTAEVLVPEFIAQVRQMAGVQRVEGMRVRPITLASNRAPVVLLAKPLRNASDDGAGDGQDSDTDANAPLPLPLVSRTLPFPRTAQHVAVFVSETMVDLYGLRLGQSLALPGIGDGQTAFVVSGIWRDYARQQGSVVMDRADFVRLTGDRATNELSIHLAPSVQASAVAPLVRALAQGSYDVVSAQTIRNISLRIFDRSFAVTYWLQAVAIGMGLMGVSASFSAQVLARRREFGLLAHLGFSRRQVLALVAGEGFLWTLLGSLAGVALGLAVSLILVYVVNPQSFHWTMALHVPVGHLLVLAVAVVLSGTLTAWFSGRLAAGQQAVLAVKQEN